MPLCNKPEKMVDQRIVAEYLGVEYRTLEHWRYRGIGPPYYRLSERRIRYKLSEVQHWLEAQRHALGVQ